MKAKQKALTGDADRAEVAGGPVTSGWGSEAAAVVVSVGRQGGADTAQTKNAAGLGAL